MHSWNGPLFQLVTEVDGIHEASDAIISRAKEIGEQNKRLLEGIEKILGQVSSSLKLHCFLIYATADAYSEKQIMKNSSLQERISGILHCRVLFKQQLNFYTIDSNISKSWTSTTVLDRCGLPDAF